MGSMMLAQFSIYSFIIWLLCTASASNAAAKTLKGQFTPFTIQNYNKCILFPSFKALIIHSYGRFGAKSLCPALCPLLPPVDAESACGCSGRWNYLFSSGRQHFKSNLALFFWFLVLFFSDNTSFCWNIYPPLCWTECSGHVILLR